MRVGRAGGEWQEVKLGVENTECLAEKSGLQPENNEVSCKFLIMKVLKSDLCSRKILWQQVGA